MFQSIASIACSCSIVCVSSSSTAPASATLVRSTRSLAITRQRGDEDDDRRASCRGLGRAPLSTSTTVGRMPSSRRSRSHSAHRPARAATALRRRVVELELEHQSPVRRVLERGALRPRASAGVRDAAQAASFDLRAHPGVGLLAREVAQARPQDHQAAHLDMRGRAPAPASMGALRPSAPGTSPQPRSGLDEPAADRVARQLDAVAHPELGQHVLAVALDRLAG